MPILNHNGRLYRAFEDCTPNFWPQGFQAGVISVPVDADLLDASNWLMSNKLPFDPAWLPAEWGTVERPGWLEGNVVAAPDNTLWNILRFNSSPVCDKATMVRVEEGGARISFDPATGFIDFPGGMTKFNIRRDSKTNLYLSLVNNNTVPEWPRQRNILSLAASEDLVTWRVVKTLMTDESGLLPEDSLRLTGFQYVEWQFDGDDIIYLVRAAYRGARNYHDANRMIYSKLADYVNYLA
jgi:hypothetical protein